MDIVTLYLLIINAVTFVLMLIDKYKAKNNLWRIPERTFLIFALLGGSVGCLGGMYAVRHKTKHISFTAGIPVILTLQIVLIIIFSVKI